MQVKGVVFMLAWLRNNIYAAGLLALIRIYVGWEWVTAGFHKLSGPTPFSAAGFLKGAIAKPVLGPEKDLVYPTFTSFMKNVALPHVGLFNTIVPWGELLVGLGLILGTLTTAAMFFGLLMNFMYTFAGTVSTNPWLIMFGAIILFAGYNAGRFGGDYWVIPWLRKYMKASKTVEFEKKTPAKI